jgi:hypothetical protein
MQKVLKLSGKRTDTEQNSGELYTKKHQQGNSYFLEIILQSLLKKIFSNYIGRILQVKRQSKRIILLFFCSVFFYLQCGRERFFITF